MTLLIIKANDEIIRPERRPRIGLAADVFPRMIAYRIDFTEGREYTTDHPIMGKDTPAYEAGKPIYRERV